jgi:O-6-methylguanine DNA methyltransferase
MFSKCTPGLHVGDSPFGAVGLAWTPRGVCRLEIGHASAEAALAALQQQCPGLGLARPVPAPVKAIVRRLQAHCQGVCDPLLDIPVDLSQVSDFPRVVLRRLRKVKPGAVVTYGELAALCGRPGAARAVGRIMGANPVPVIVPCHRCLGADGSLTGFSAAGGTALKARLLHAEGYVRDPEHAAGLTHLQRVDRKLGRLIERVGPYLALPDKPLPPYDTLVKAIVHQQLSLKAGQTIAARVRDLTPGAHFPTPSEMLALDPTALRACGLSNSKVSFVRDLAARVGDGRLNLRQLHRLDDEAVVAKLTEVHGIGVWSAHMHLIFHLGRLDVLPVGDLGVRMGAARLYGLAEQPTPAELTALAEKWRPYRSLGSWYMWRALEGGGL